MDWNTLANLAIATGTIGALIMAWQARNKKTEVLVQPQPVKVQITEELHELFASKQEFDAHCQNNTGRHSQLFNRIDALSAETRLADKEIKRDLDEKFQSIQRALGRIEGKIDSK